MKDLTGTGLDVGDSRTVTATFLDAAGAPASIVIDDVQVTTRPPSGPIGVVDPGNVTVASNAVSHTILFTEGGRWYGRTYWNDGTNAQAEEWTARVDFPRAEATT